MANVLGELFQDIADAIRSKTGSTDKLKPNQFPEAIEGITTGGGEGEKPFDCHSVTFVYGDKSYVRSVADGDTCADPVARGLIPTPTKESTAQYNYTYGGWSATNGGKADSTVLQNITEDKTVYAAFDATVRSYTITFYDDNGTTVLARKEVEYGKIPSHTPTKTGKAFDKWTPTPTAVTGEASYTANWLDALGSGTFGNGLTWLLDGDGTLTISGTGAMPDYTAPNSTPWYSLQNKIKKVVFADGITHVGAYAFQYFAYITSVQIPESVTSIGTRAFEMTYVKSVVIPDSVTTMASDVFNSCYELTNVTLSANLTEIPMRTFHSCWKLTSIVIPASVVKIHHWAFPNGSNVFASAIFEDPNGWYVSTSDNASSGTTLSLSNPSTNAKYLTTDYHDYYWYNT